MLYAACYLWLQLPGGFRISGQLYNRLYSYQKTGVAWMWSLHRRGPGVGGILGDDMGLGKTFQVGRCQDCVLPTARGRKQTSTI